MAQHVAVDVTIAADADLADAALLQPDYGAWRAVACRRCRAAGSETVFGGNLLDGLRGGRVAKVNELVDVGIVGERVVAKLRLDQQVGLAVVDAVLGVVQQVDDARGNTEHIGCCFRCDGCRHIDRYGELGSHLGNQADRDVVDQPAVNQQVLVPLHRRVGEGYRHAAAHRAAEVATRQHDAGAGVQIGANGAEGDRQPREIAPGSEPCLGEMFNQHAVDEVVVQKGAW